MVERFEGLIVDDFSENIMILGNLLGTQPSTARAVFAQRAGAT